MKRIIKLLTCTFIIFLFIGININASNDNYSIDLNFGFDDYYKLDKDMPVTIRLMNNIEDFSGTLQIRYHVNNVNDGMVSQKITLEKGIQKKINVILPNINEDTSMIKVIIKENEDIAYEKKFRVPYTQAITNDLMLGILAEDYDELNYFNSDVCTKVRLDENNFPEDIFASEILDVIMINNYDLSKLNDSQIDVLKKWVNNGGHLIIGSGVNYSKTIPLLQDFLDIDSITNLNEIDNNIFYSFINKQLDENAINNTTPLSIIELSSDTLKEALSKDEYVLIYNLKKGNGNIDLYTFDLGMEPMKSYIYNNEFMNLYLSSKFANRQLNLDSNANYFLSIMPQIKYPTMWKIIIIIVIYILLIGPVLYIILKKKHKRQYMWIYIPVISIIFVAILYFSGMNTKIKEPISQMLNIISFSDDGRVVKSFGTVLNTNNSKLEIESNDNLSMMPLLNTYYTTISEIEYTDLPLLYNHKLGLEQKIEYTECTIFENYNFKVDSSDIIPQDNLIDLDVKADGNELTGSITNNYDFDLNYCLLYYNNKIYTIDHLSTKEVKNIGEPSANDYIELMSYIWEISRNESNTLQERKEIYQNSEMINYIQYIYNNISNDKIIFIGFTDKNFSNGFQVNNKTVKNKEKTMITSLSTISYPKGSSVVFDYGTIKPLVNNTIGQNIFYANDQDEISYKLPINTIDLTLITIRRNPMYINKFQEGKYYVVANDNSKIELTDTITIDQENLDEYVKNGELKIVIKLDVSTDIDLPEIYVEGIGK